MLSTKTHASPKLPKDDRFLNEFVNEIKIDLNTHIFIVKTLTG